jgi:hypothetical protein
MLIQSSRVAILVLIAAVTIPMAQEMKSGASVSGRVTNSATGAPVVRAHVIFYGERQRFGALTGVDGKFSISPLPGGKYSISAEAPGFQPLPLYDTSSNHLTLRSGERKNDMDIALTPSGSISGRILDGEGRPLQGVALSVLSLEGVIEGNPSDPDGRYEFSDLPPGKYRVLAEPGSSGSLAPEIRTDGTNEIHYSPTYYPSSLTLDFAGRLDVQPGAERTGIDIRMVRTPIVAVRGNVSGIPAGVSEIFVTVHKIEPPIREGKSLRRMSADQRRVDQDGSFVLWRLDPGSYVLVAQSYPEGWASPPLAITVADKDLDGIALRLIRQFEISGQLTFADPRDRLPKIPANASLAETPQFHMNGLQTYAWASSLIAADGSFHLDKVLPEQYSVYVTGSSYIKSMRLDSTNIGGRILDLRNGSNNASLTLVADSALGRIGGVVRNDAGPAAYARIAMLPELGSFRSDPIVLSADSQGTYSFDYIAPGKYSIMALDAGANHARALQYHLGDYQDIIQAIEIHPGDKLVQDLARHSGK